VKFSKCSAVARNLGIKRSAVHRAMPAAIRRRNRFTRRLGVALSLSLARSLAPSYYRETSKIRAHVRMYARGTRVPAIDTLTEQSRPRDYVLHPLKPYARAKVRARSGESKFLGT